MNTQLNVDVELLEEAKKVLHVTDDVDAVRIALLRVVKKPDLRALKSYYGELDLDVDLDVLRGRDRISGE